MSKIKINSKTGKPIRKYEYHISKTELKEVNKRKSEALKKFLSDPKKRKARAKRQWAIYHSDPVRQERRRLATKKALSNPKTKESLSKSQIKSWKNPVVRQRRLNGMREAMLKPEYGEKIRAGHKKLMNDPERASKVIQKRI